MAHTYWPFGAQLTVLADEEQTDSHFDLIEGQFPPGFQTPLYRHSKYTEMIYVLEGEFSVYIDTEVVIINPGGGMLIPKMTPHVVVASAKAFSRALTVVSPSAFARLIRSAGIPELGEGLPPGQPNDSALFLKLSEETGDEILCPPSARPVPKQLISRTRLRDNLISQLAS